MAITKEQFVIWKQDQVTQAVFESIKEQIEGIKEILADSAGTDDRADRYLTGMIKAFRNVLDTEVEEVQ